MSETTRYRERVYSIVREIPPGRVITYGAIAHLLGDPRQARQVGWAMARTPDECPPIPAHRVVNSRGAVSPDGDGGNAVRRRLLEAEGVVFGSDGRLDLERYLWLPGDSPTREQARNSDENDRADDRYDY